jgi:hypothetical protein
MPQPRVRGNDQAGGLGLRRRCDKALQGTHLKRWTLGSLLRTDINARAIPWARLMLTTRQPVEDLNLRRDQRLSAALTALAAVCLLLAPLWTVLARPPGLCSSS